MFNVAAPDDLESIQSRPRLELDCGPNHAGRKCKNARGRLHYLRVCGLLDRHYVRGRRWRVRTLLGARARGVGTYWPPTN